MSDEPNKIIDPSQPTPLVENAPLKIDMSHERGVVKVIFDPAIVRMKMKPREARQFALSMFNHAEAAEMMDELPSQIIPITAQ
jgi:hypothetical protein